MAAKVQWDRGAWWVITHAHRKRRRRRFGPTAADKRRAERAAEEINHRLALGQYKPEEREKPIPFDARLREWHRTYAPTFKYSYEITSRALIENHLAPFFGSKCLREVREEDLLRYIREKQAAGLAPSTIQNGLTIVRRVLNLAHRDGLIARNPAARVGELMKRVGNRAASEIKEVDTWTRDEVGILLDVAREDEARFYPALSTLFATGLRRGELLGLKWEDVDLERGRISIRRALVRGRPTTPKSGKGRSIAIPAALASLLLDLLAQRHRECLTRGWPEVPEWVFCSEVGGPLEERNVERAWFRVRRRARKRGVRPLRLHCARHTYASMALASGKSIRWVADQLGHSNPELTLRTYAHVIPNEETDLGFAEFAFPHGPGRPYTAPTRMDVFSDEDAAELTTRRRLQNMERETGLEPATLSLGNSRGNCASSRNRNKSLGRCCRKNPPRRAPKGLEGPFRINQEPGAVIV